MYLSRIYPQPAKFNESGGAPFVFGAVVKAYAPASLSDAVRQSLSRLWNSFSFTASKLEICDLPAEERTNTLIIGDYPQSEAFALDAGEYFTIRADARGAVISAVSEKALIDGFSSLVQLITPKSLGYGSEELYIEPAEIVGKPTLKARMIHLCVFPESELPTLEKAIAFAGFLGFTHVILEFWGMLRYDSLPELGWEHAFTKAQIKPLIDLAHGWGMEVVPMINHLGHATQSRCGMGRHTVLNQNPRLQMYFEPDGWTWCATNPDTRRLLSDIRAELIELCGDSDYFHLGFDEAYSFASCPECRRQIPHELLAEYINYLADELAKYNRRAIIWHDELIDRSQFPADFPQAIVANGGGHKTTGALELLDRSIIIADWQYEYTGKANPTTPYFIEKGFDVLCCPWDNPANVKSLCDSARESGAMGVMLTTWHHLPDCISKLPRFAEFVAHGGDYAPVPITETAALLRKLYPAVRQTYSESGWRGREVEG